MKSIVPDSLYLCYNLCIPMKKKVFFTGAFFVIFGLFIFYRIPSLLAHYVAYTSDQGRDFIAAANIVLLHKIPFIGPTTGINDYSTVPGGIIFLQSLIFCFMERLLVFTGLIFLSSSCV